MLFNHYTPAKTSMQPHQNSRLQMKNIIGLQTILPADDVFEREI
jgi:hypothetical protein